MRCWCAAGIGWPNRVGATPNSIGAVWVCVAVTAKRSGARPVFARSRLATVFTIGHGTPRLSTVMSTAGPFWPSSIASALAQIFWVTPSDSARRKPKPLSRTGNSGVTSIAAAPMRHPAWVSVGTNATSSKAATNGSGFMQRRQYGREDTGRKPPLGQARRILGKVAFGIDRGQAPRLHCARFPLVD